MSTFEEFENAPVGATARHPDGRVAVKTPHKGWPWSLFDWAGERIAHGGNHYMTTQGYTLNPATAREALALAEAGLLARTLPDRDEIADELSGWPIGTGYYQASVAYDEARDMDDAVLDLLKGQDQ